MNFYDKVHEMVRAFKDTPEFREYVELKNKLKEEKDAYDRLKDFKERQKNYQMEYIDGKEQSKEKLEEMQNLYSIVIQNETSRKLLENEMKINVMLADMQKIIGDALKDIIDF
ncbi:MAG: YlbF family regulator [Christensenellales bacterium]